MLNKKNLIKLSLGVMAMGMMGMPLFSSAEGVATQLFNLFMTKDYWMDTGSISPIHFADNGNDFGGLIFFENLGNENGEEGNDEDTSKDYVVELGSDRYKCKIQVKGLYYDSQRGERLWPLDESTSSIFGMSGDGLILSGGIYTKCTEENYTEELAECAKKEGDEKKTCEEDVETNYGDNGGYYGMVTHEYGGRKYSLIAGVGYKTGSNWIEIKANEGLVPSFVRYNNKTPLGFIYDSNGGVGFVGCKVGDNGGLSKIAPWLSKANPISSCFKYDSNGEYLVVTNCLDISDDLSFDCKMGGSDMNSLLKFVIEGVVGISTDVKNEKVENNFSTEKFQLFASSSVNNATLINYTKQKAESLCRGKWGNCSNNNCTDKVVCIENGSNGVDASSYNGKTLIVKKGDVKVSPDENIIYNIYIGDGNLLINESGSGDFVIGKNGFIADEASTGNYNEYFSGNQHIGDPKYVGVASVLRGNFVVNGKVKSSNSNKKLSNKYFVYGKLTSLDSIREFEETFAWRCVNKDGTPTGTDGYICPESKYKNASLSIIDQNYEWALQ